MNELIEILVPPENATREDSREARKYNKCRIIARIFPLICSKIVQGEKDMQNRVDDKNSGGEGQNPLYIALLADFCTDLQNQSVSEDRH